MADKQLVEKIMSGEGEGAYLVGADLNRANLRNADFYQANLKGANLQGANLQGANLWGANLQGANLQGANLKGASLYGADLSGAKLEGANLKGANLTYAYLEGADLRGILYDGKTKWPRGFTPPGEGRMASRASQGGRKASGGSRYAAGKIVAPKDVTHDVLKEVTDVIEQYVRSSSQIEDLVTQSILRLKAKYERKYDGFRLRDPQAIAQDFLYFIQLNPSMNYDKAREVLGNYTHVISSPSDRMASRSDRLSRFEEGVPADPTKNMSPEDAAEWEEMTEKYKDKFKKASGGSRYAAGKIVAREPYMRALQRMQDAFDRSGGDPVKLYDAIDRRVRATRELGKLQGIYDAIIFDVMRGTFGPVPRFLDMRYKALLDQLQQVLRVSRAF